MESATPGQVLHARARRRVIAHFLANRLIAPQSDDDDELRRWANSIVQQLGDDELTMAVTQTSNEARLLACAAYMRTM